MSESETVAPLPIDIISIQSQVVYGYVGNNAAVPILQSYGLNVCAVPTVFLSNTPLYPTFYGGRIPDDWFHGYLKALNERNILAHCKHIILGYLGSPTQAGILYQWLRDVRQNYPHITIQIDPVLGDTDCGLYVDENLAKNYREELRHISTGMTPNHFELEYLSGRKLNSLEDTIEAARSLLSDNTKWIITTSAAPETWQRGETQIAIVEADREEIRTHTFYQIKAQGTGDTFAATLAANLLHGETLSNAAQQAANRVMQVVELTNKTGSNELQLIKALY